MFNSATEGHGLRADRFAAGPASRFRAVYFDVVHEDLMRSSDVARALDELLGGEGPA